jgi:hypothetical protein
MEKNSDSETQNFLWVKLIDCDTTYLENIIGNIPKLYSITKNVILAILRERYKIEAEKVIDEKLNRIQNQIEGFIGKDYKSDRMNYVQKVIERL